MLKLMDTSTAIQINSSLINVDHADAWYVSYEIKVCVSNAPNSILIKTQCSISNFTLNTSKVWQIISLTDNLNKNLKTLKTTLLLVCNSFTP